MYQKEAGMCIACTCSIYVSSTAALSDVQRIRKRYSIIIIQKNVLKENAYVYRDLFDLRLKYNCTLGYAKDP